MWSVKKIYRFLIASALLHSFLYGGELPFERLSIEAGLSQSVVYTILQDTHGFIWFGTQNGLNKYDGHTFTVFRHLQNDSLSLVDNNIRVIYEDRFHKLWIGTHNGLSRFDPVTETFQSFRHNPDDSTSLSNNRIYAIAEDRDGRLWISADHGLNFFDRAAGTVRRYFSADSGSSLSAARVRAMYAAPDSALWLATMGDGLKRFNPKTGAVTHFSHDRQNVASISSNVLMCLRPDPRDKNQLWIGTHGGGLNRFDLTTQRVVRYNHKPGDRNSLSDNRVFDIFGDPAGHIWIGTFAGGLNRFNPESGDFTVFKHDPLKLTSLSADFVRCVYVDATSNLWVGVNFGGLNKVDIKPKKFLRSTHVPHEPESLRHNFVNAIFESRQGTLWVGTRTGVDILPRGKQAFEHLTLTAENDAGRQAFVSALWVKNDSAAWIGSFGDGLFEVDRHTGVKRRITHDPDIVGGLAANRIRDLYYDGAGFLWIATVAGVNRLDLQTGVIATFKHDKNNPNSLSSNSVQFVRGDSRGNIWMGTNSSGLNKFDPRSRQFTNFTHDPAAQHSIPHNAVNAFYEDNDGNLWVGTNYGFSRLDWQAPEGEQFNNYFESDGLLNNYVCAILGDQTGNLWISASGGISRFNPKLPIGRQFRNYDWSDGLQGQIFIDGAAFSSNSGELFLGGSDGLVRFHPYNVQDNPYPPKVMLTAFNIFDQPTRLDTAISQITRIELSHKQNFFSLEFAALDFTQPQKNRYAYKMYGFNEEWVQAGSRRYASYTNLDHGTYRFQVKGSNNDGVWNEQGASLTIVIKPPLWAAWWARLFYVLFGLGLFLGFRKYERKKRRQLETERRRREREEGRGREALLRAQAAEMHAKAMHAEQELEKQKMRNLIATDLHDEIGGNLSSIALSSELLEKRSDIDGDLRACLVEICRTARLSTSAIRDIIWALNPTSDKVSALIMRMKDTAGSLFGEIPYDFIASHGEVNSKLNPEVKRNVYLIYKEALHNILKHAQASNVRIEVARHKNKLSLTIVDDGAGFDETETRRGNGLRNMHSRAEQIGADFELSSTPGQGVRIRLAVKIT